MPGTSTAHIEEPAAMPTYFISLSLTRPPNASDSDILQLLQRAADSARCVPVEISAVGLIVECDPAALNLLEEIIRRDLAIRRGSLDSISVKQI
jgi:hypothetical protein